MWGDDDYVPLSALQHAVYCERQAALIHIDRVWSDDAATARGHVVHERAHEVGVDHRRGVRVARSLPLRSDRLGVIGIADLVELHDHPAAPRRVRPVPVEIKSGKRKNQLADQVQLCAQGMCLEEMFETEVREGFVYYAASKRRVSVALDDKLRERTLAVALRVREMFAAAETPAARYVAARCGPCSLRERCLPSVTGPRDASRTYLTSLLATASED